MLVFTRRDGEQFVCEELGLVVTMLEARDVKARIGIEAPKELKIHRGEIVGRARLAYEQSTQCAQKVA